MQIKDKITDTQNGANNMQNKSIIDAEIRRGINPYYNDDKKNTSLNALIIPIDKYNATNRKILQAGRRKK
jgi:hypothetical protein